MFEFKEIVENSKMAVFVVSETGNLFYKNKSATELIKTLELNEKDNILLSFENIFENFDIDKLLLEPEVLFYKKNKKECFYFEINVEVKFIDSDKYYVFNFYDVSLYKKELLESEIYKTIFDSVASTIVITDLRGNIEKVNPAFEKLTGYTSEEAIGQNPRILKSDYHSDKFFKELWKTLLSGKTWRGTFRDKIKSGELIWEKSVISPIRDEHGNISKYVAIKENISKEKDQEIKLKQLSYQDYLTGLYNRRKFMMYMEELISLALKENIYLFCLMIDIDNFKKVNDTYGHEIGDKVLVQLAKNLERNVRGDDIASRLGGEEFVVVLSNYTYEQAILRGLKIKDDIENSVIVSNQEKIAVTASIGFAQYDNKSSINEWLKMADEALYEAKNSGKNKLCEYKASKL